MLFAALIRPSPLSGADRCQSGCGGRGRSAVITQMRRGVSPNACADAGPKYAMVCPQMQGDGGNLWGGVSVGGAVRGIPQALSVLRQYDRGMCQKPAVSGGEESDESEVGQG